MRRFPSSLLQFTSRERLPSYFAIGMLIGAIWYFSIDFEPSLAVLAICALIAGLFVWLAARFLQMTTVFAAAGNDVRRDDRGAGRERGDTSPFTRAD